MTIIVHGFFDEGERRYICPDAECVKLAAGPLRPVTDLEDEIGNCEGRLISCGSCVASLHDEALLQRTSGDVLRPAFEIEWAPPALTESES